MNDEPSKTQIVVASVFAGAAVVVFAALFIPFMAVGVVVNLPRILFGRL